MAYQFINVGAVPNDNTGDTLRNAFIKINNNFSSSLDTGSIVSSSISSSYTLTASYTLNVGTFLITGSTYSITSSVAISSSYITASGITGQVNSASVSQTSSFLKLWDSGLNSWVTISSYNGILTVN